MKKETQYAIKIIAQLQGLFDEDCENFIDISELKEGKNVNHFTHALANIAPTMLVNKLANQKLDLLGFNHMANKLCMLYINIVETEK